MVFFTEDTHLGQEVTSRTTYIFTEIRLILFGRKRGEGDPIVQKYVTTYRTILNQSDHSQGSGDTDLREQITFERVGLCHRNERVGSVEDDGGMRQNSAG